MAQFIPLKVDITTGKLKFFATTDTVAVNNLAPSGSDGDVLTKDSTLSDGKKWVTPTASTSSRAFPFFAS
jgi:hypothetical protein